MQVQTVGNNSISSASATANVSSSPISKVTPPAINADMQSKLAQLGVVDSSHSKKNKSHSKFAKQIPTIFGLLILFAAMISGVFLFGQGTGVFAPRATPETTPKDIVVSNVTDKSFTVSFFTDESTLGFVKYGQQETKYDKQSSDDRDQLSGIVKDYRLHQVTVRGLQANTVYYYVLGTGSNTFNNQGQPYTIQTAAKPAAAASNNQTVYGNVFLSEQVPAEGSIVFVDSAGMNTLSTLVKASGSFGLSLANAFNTDRNNFAAITEESVLSIRVQTPDPNISTHLETSLSQAQPIANIFLNSPNSTALVDNKNELLAPANVASESSSSALRGVDLTAEGISTQDSQIVDSSASSTLADMLGAASPVVEQALPPKEAEIIDLSKVTNVQEKLVLETTQPEIRSGGLPAETTIHVVIHSDTKIDQTVKTDANGGFSLDVAALGQNLEPGEHSASYSYTDPVTGQEVTKTYNFTVADTATARQLAQITSAATPTTKPSLGSTATVSVPYGSGNPYLPPTTSATATITSNVSSNSTVVSTASGTYSSGSVTETFLLLVGGFFFILVGVWSYALSAQFEPKKG